MKFQKSSRIIAIALAVVMILPLISVMAFADGEGEATSNVHFSADFENYELTAALDAADDTFFGDGKGAGINGASLSYKEGNVPADAPKTTSGNKIVLDPLAAEGAENVSKVWEMDVPNNNNNNNIRLNVDALDAATTKNMTFSFKIYIPEDAYGTVQWQWATDAPKSNDWTQLGNIEFKAGDAVLKPSGTLTVEGTKASKTVARGVWNTITYAFNLETGDFAWYINGNDACAGNLGAGAYKFRVDKLHFGKVLNGSSDYSTNKGKVYFDDISIVKEAYQPETLWASDYSGYEVGAGVAKDDKNFGAEPNKFTVKEKDADGKDVNVTYDKNPAMHTIVADPVVEGNKVLSVNNYGGKNQKAEADNNWDNNGGKYAVPEISYKNTQAVTFGFDIYIPKTTRGQIHWQWGGVGYDANNTEVTTNKAWNDIIYIYQDPDQEYATLANVGKQNIDDKDESVWKLPKETWVRIEYSVDLVTGESNLTVNGKQAWRGYYTVNSTAVTNITLQANGLIYSKLLKDAHCKDGTNTGVTLFKNETVTVGKNVRNDPAFRYGQGVMYVQDFNDFKAEQSLAFGGDSGFVADSKVVEAHKAVVDPKDEKNIVWYRPLDDAQGANDDPWCKLGNDRAAFAENPVVEVTTDYYLPADATGYFQVQLYGSASGTNNYFHLWDINVTDAKLVEHYDGTAPFTAKVEDEKAFALPRDTWFTVRTIVDLVSGKFDIFVDGNWVASCHIRGGDKNIIISADNLDVSCLRCSQGAAASYTGMATYVQSGYVLIDNIELKKFNGSVVKVNADLPDGVLGVKVGEKALETGVHVFEEAVKAENVDFDTTPFANLFKSTIGEFRLCEDEGIRFVTEIDATVLAALLADTNTSDALVKKGTIILPANYVTEGLEITFEGLAAAGIDYLDVTYEDLTAEYAENKIAGSIYNIKTTNTNREFIAVPYVQVTLPHGNTLTIYGAASEGVTVAELAAAALANTTATYNGTEKALLEEYAAKVKAD